MSNVRPETNTSLRLVNNVRTVTPITISQQYYRRGGNIINKLNIRNSFLYISTLILYICQQYEKTRSALSMLAQNATAIKGFNSITVLKLHHDWVFLLMKTHSDKTNWKALASFQMSLWQCPIETVFYKECYKNIIVLNYLHVLLFTYIKNVPNQNKKIRLDKL